MSKNTKFLLIFSIIIFIISIGIFAFFQINSKQLSNTNTPNTNNGPIEFTFTNSEGTEFKIDNSSNLGKAIIFWNSDSENSLDILEMVDSYYETYKDDIDFYIINTNEKYNDIISLTNNLDFKFPIYFDNNNEASNFYDIKNLPTFVFIDKDNEIHTINGGIDEDTLTANLDLLAEFY